MRIIERYLSRLEHCKLAAKFTNPAEALAWMNANPVHVLFLDISMPNMTGLELIGKITCKPAVIFTTAYSEFASNAFDLDAADYLLKPFSFDRFARAVAKAADLLQATSSDLLEAGALQGESTLTIRCDGRLVKVNIDDIIYVQAFQEYVSIFTRNQRFVIYERLKNMEKILPGDRFYRTHRSYLVCLDKIRSFSGNLLEVEAFEIPVSRSNKDGLLKRFQR
ncbi:MAG: hypothetical protein RI973_1662 [Bacteroidota bacterium]